MNYTRGYIEEDLEWRNWVKKLRAILFDLYLSLERKGYALVFIVFPFIIIFSYFSPIFPLQIFNFFWENTNYLFVQAETQETEKN